MFLSSHLVHERYLEQSFEIFAKLFALEYSDKSIEVRLKVASIYNGNYDLQLVHELVSSKIKLTDKNFNYQMKDKSRTLFSLFKYIKQIYLRT